MHSIVPPYEFLHACQCFFADMMLDALCVDGSRIVTDSQRNQELHDDVVTMSRESGKFLSLFRELDRTVRLGLDESVALHASECP